MSVRANQPEPQDQSERSSNLRVLPQPAPKPRVVVVGGGFGGLNVVRELANKDVEVLVLDRNNYHGFWPLLYQIATAALLADSIGYPIREVTHRYPNTRFQMAEVERVDLENKQVITDGGPVSYDYLVMAAGSINNFFGNQTIKHNVYSLKDIDEALELRDGLLEAFEEASRETDPQRKKELMTFVIVGAGPTGVELAGAFADLICPLITKSYPALNSKDIRIVLVEAHNSMLEIFPKTLQDKAQKDLEKMGVEILPFSPVVSVDKGCVTFKDGRTLKAGTVVWAAGVKASELAKCLEVELKQSGRVPVQPTLNLEKHPEVYVIGDMAYLQDYKNGKEAYPMVAPVAIQMAKRASRNILAQVQGKPLKKFKYLDKGNMATIGRSKAVVDAFGISMDGWFAWIVWLLVHLFFLIGYRNRFLVILSWAYDYITYNRGIRLLGGRRDGRRVVV
ncbi:MAG TPA: NAD(P)/FAD-dependent oxidoreductase [Chloroflexia bacterium]|nr:NAD(P)/FAD-dependent oxidoreductase [Chloroflexia bacterium]